MKTKHIKIFTIILATATLSACNDFLEVKPQGQIILDDFWKSEADVDAVIATCYKELMTTDDRSTTDKMEIRNMEKFMVWGELRSDNITGTTNPGDNEKRILESNILPDNAYASWSGLYTTINYCNSVLYYAPKVIDPNFTQKELETKMAEALTLRAIAYFYLVRVFKDVPLIVEPSLDDD